MLDSDKDETANILAQINWNSAWKRLMEGVVDESREKNNLVLRQHAMLTRGLLEIMMLVGYRMYVDDAKAHGERTRTINAAIEKMEQHAGVMKRITEIKENSDTIPDFVSADIQFHMVIPLILESEAQQFLPVSAKEMERFLTQSLLGRNTLRFKTPAGRMSIVAEHQAILARVREYLTGTSIDPGNKNEVQSGKGKKILKSEENDFLCASKVTRTLGRHLFKAIYSESNSDGGDRFTNNMTQLRETALMFNLLMSEGFGFDPIDLWEKGEIDQLIFLSDCYPPKELKHFTSDRVSSCSIPQVSDKENTIKLQQVRLVLAIRNALLKQQKTGSKDSTLKLYSMAIFVPGKEVIDDLVDNDLLSRESLLKAYGLKAGNGKESDVKGKFDCGEYVFNFKKQIRELFKDLESHDTREALLKVEENETKRERIRSEILEFLDNEAKSSRGKKRLNLNLILGSIRFFKLPASIHKRFIVEPGGTIAWHFHDNNLVYTYRQDGDEVATRVVDTRGDRRYEIFDLLFSIIDHSEDFVKKHYFDMIDSLQADIRSPILLNPNEQTVSDNIKLYNGKQYSEFLRKISPELESDKSSTAVSSDPLASENPRSELLFAANTISAMMASFLLEDPRRIKDLKAALRYRAVVSKNCNSPEVITSKASTHI